MSIFKWGDDVGPRPRHVVIHRAVHQQYVGPQVPGDARGILMIVRRLAILLSLEQPMNFSPIAQRFSGSDRRNLAASAMASMPSTSSSSAREIEAASISGSVTIAHAARALADGSARTLDLAQKPHSVCVLELIDESIPAMDPRVEIRSATSVKAGESVAFGATASSGAAPVLACHWGFGDGTGSDGMNVTHTFAHAGGYTVQVTTTGLGATTDRKSVTVSVSGEVSTQFEKDQKVRPAL
jgi:hypothetical protein